MQTCLLAGTSLLKSSISSQRHRRIIVMMRSKERWHLCHKTTYTLQSHKLRVVTSNVFEHVDICFCKSVFCNRCNSMVLENICTCIVIECVKRACCSVIVVIAEWLFWCAKSKAAQQACLCTSTDCLKTQVVIAIEAYHRLRYIVLRYIILRSFWGTLFWGILFWGISFQGIWIQGILFRGVCRFEMYIVLRCISFWDESIRCVLFWCICVSRSFVLRCIDARFAYITLWVNSKLYNVSLWTN